MAYENNGDIEMPSESWRKDKLMMLVKSKLGYIVILLKIHVIILLISIFH